jgi:hypothetical protein
MQLINSNWTKSESELYLKLFIGQSNISPSREMKDLYASDMKFESFRRICKEFSKDNDFQCLTKLLSIFNTINYSELELKSTILKIKRFLKSIQGCKQMDNARLMMVNRLVLAN